MRYPNLLFGIVVILSTMSVEIVAKSIPIAWLDHYSKKRRFTLVACDDADRNRFCCVETII